MKEAFVTTKKNLAHGFTRNQQQFFSFSLLQGASSMILIRAAAQSLERLIDHSLQLRRFFIQSLEKKKAQTCKLVLENIQF